MSKYKVVDTLNQGWLSDKTFNSKGEIRNALFSFHSTDGYNTDELKKLSLVGLVKLGSWEIKRVCPACGEKLVKINGKLTTEDNMFFFCHNCGKKVK